MTQNSAQCALLVHYGPGGGPIYEAEKAFKINGWSGWSAWGGSFQRKFLRECLRVCPYPLFLLHSYKHIGPLGPLGPAIDFKGLFPVLYRTTTRTTPGPLQRPINMNGHSYIPNPPSEILPQWRVLANADAVRAYRGNTIVISRRSRR